MNIVRYPKSDNNVDPADAQTSAASGGFLPARALVDLFPAESILRIVLHHGYAVRLADGERIEHADDVPVWLCFALTLYRYEILALMRRDFCGNWRGPRECDRGPEGWQQ